MATSAITNTITDPAGTALSGVVVNARLKPNGGGFRVSDWSEATTLVSTTTNGSGVWTLNLERNSNITPGNSYYEVEERIPDSAGGSRTWVIQVGASNQTVYAALVSTPPSSPGVNYLTQSSADARYLSVFAGTLGTDITQVGTNTLTGTSTTWASSGHKHSLSSDVVGSGLTLTNGVLSATGGSNVSVDGPIQSVGTATITGTATTAAPSNHRHPLDPAVAGTGLSLAAGVLSVTTVVPSASNEIQAVGTATITGTTTSFARANHAHALSPAVVGSGLALASGIILGPIAGTNTPQAINTATVTGTSTSWALSDHSHTLNPGMTGSGLALTAGVLSVSPAVPSSGAGSLVTQVNTNTATGVATSYALTDHQHSLASGIIGSGLTLAAGVVTPTYGATANIVAVGTATFSGTLTSLARADHAHPLSPAVVGSGLALTAGVLSVSPAVPTAGAAITAVNTATATGVSSNFARDDHQHSLASGIIGNGLSLAAGVVTTNYGATANIVAVGTATFSGVSVTLARADHAHTISPAAVGAGLTSIAGVLSVNGPSNVQYLTATITTTVNISSGARAILVEMVGGGGSGGSVAGSSTQAGGSSGGGSGSYLRKLIVTPSSSYSYVVGVGGTAPTAGGNNGNPGSDSTFGTGGSLLTAKGGAGGFTAGLGTVAASTTGGSGGTVATGGDVNCLGQDGIAGFTNSASSATSGAGGPSYFSGGGTRTAGSADGTAGVNGSGGSGAATRSVNTNRAGGAGGTGLIVITEYF